MNLSEKLRSKANENRRIASLEWQPNKTYYLGIAEAFEEALILFEQWKAQHPNDKDKAIYNKTETASRLGVSVYQVNRLISEKQLNTISGLPNKISATELKRFREKTV
jgi:hypothetical protein